jgi:2-dehydropantoate 2-reductase
VSTVTGFTGSTGAAPTTGGSGLSGVTWYVVPGATTTVLQDWRKSRHSEVDDLNGHVVAEGARLGIATPMNSTVVEIAHRIERGELAPDPANFALMAAAAR